MGETPDNSPLFTSLAGAAQYHYDVVDSLARYLGTESRGLVSRFGAFPERRVVARPSDYLKETDRRSSLAILTSIEAAFLRDYRHRSHRHGPKDDLSKAFRAIRKSGKAGARPDLDPDLLDAWAEHASGARSLIGDLRSAFKYRHWLAHGRHWTPNLRHDYDFEKLYRLADAVFNALPLFGLDGI
jgi:hypothetical protein